MRGWLKISFMIQQTMDYNGSDNIAFRPHRASNALEDRVSQGEISQTPAPTLPPPQEKNLTFQKCNGNFCLELKKKQYLPQDAITGSSGCLTMDLILPEHFPMKLPNSFPEIHKNQTLNLTDSSNTEQFQASLKKSPVQTTSFDLGIMRNKRIRKWIK